MLFIFLQKSVLLVSWKCPYLNITYSLSACTHYGCECTYTSWKCENPSFLKMICKINFLYSCYFLPCEMFWQMLFCCFCSPSSDCVAGNLKEHPECVWVWVWACECKNSILSNREIQTVENCIRNVSTDLRLFFFCLSVLTLLVCLSCFCRMNLHFVFSVFHILKEILMLYFLLHVSLK